MTFIFALASGWASEKQALVIIDMQPDFIERQGVHNKPANKKSLKEVLAHQEMLIASAKASQTPIIFIEYDGYGQTHSALRSAVGDYANVNTFKKSTSGMFDSRNSFRGELEDHLQENGIKDLLIAGANGGACVEQSIEGALFQNYNVIASSRGIADFNYDPFIYPYVSEYDFSKHCPSCGPRYRQVHDPLVMALEMIRSASPEISESINNSARGGMGLLESKDIWFDYMKSRLAPGAGAGNER
jgi:nicotinamidase-related amidase